jgi:hypothetical protein
MARKKHRPAASSTAVVSEPPRLVAAPGGPKMTSSPPQGQVPFLQTPFGAFLKRLFKAFASLQMAICLLSLFTVCLIGATLIESRYDSAAIAGELVYHTWWFALLLFLLAVNILCAALKKYPWKKYQTGFLVTHSGLLVLVFGGLLTALWGVEGQMRLIDTKNKTIQAQEHTPNQTNIVHLAGSQKIEVFRFKPEAFHDEAKFAAVRRAIHAGRELDDDQKKLLLEAHDLTFTPGSFVWYDDEYAPDFRSRLPWSLRMLQTLASPLPGFDRDLGDGASLAVNNYYPHAETWPYKAANKSDTNSFPALRILIQLPMGGQPIERWATGDIRPAAGDMPITLEMTTTDEPQFVQEFLAPPPTQEEAKRNPLPNGPDPKKGVQGPQGQAVLLLGGQVVRVPVDRNRLNDRIEVPGTGFTVQVVQVANAMEEALRARKDKDPHKEIDPERLPLYPMVKLEISGPRGKQEVVALARAPHMTSAFDREGRAARVPVWYHYPDPSWGNKSLKGSLQFLQGPGDRVYYRAYGQDGLRGPGEEIDPRDEDTLHPLPWKPMNLQFRVGGFLPQAVAEESVVPRVTRPGSEISEQLAPAIRATLTSGKDRANFWVRLGRTTEVPVGKQYYLVRYRQDSFVANFTLTLKRAWEVKDPGSDRPAWFQSNVLLTEGKNGQPSEHQVYMNHTLDHGLFKVYQANYRVLSDENMGDVLVDPDTGRKVSESGLQVAYDPGLWFKYAGTLIVVLGIATMFYMKAYFFKPRGRRETDEEAVANEVVLPA